MGRRRCATCPIEYPLQGLCPGSTNEWGQDGNGGIEMRTTSLLYPCDGADGVADGSEVAKLGYGSVVGRPEVYTGAETDTEDVGATPIDEVEIEIIGKVGGVEDAIRGLAYGTGLAAWRLEELAGRGSDGRHGIGFVGGRVKTTGGRGWTRGRRSIVEDPSSGGSGGGDQGRGRRRGGTGWRSGPMGRWRSDFGVEDGSKDGVCLFCGLVL